MALELRLDALPRAALAVECWCSRREEVSLAGWDQALLLADVLVRLRCSSCNGGLKAVRLVRPVNLPLCGPGAYG